MSPREPAGAPPGCPHAPDCPGCPLIEQPYARGLELKRGRVEQAFARYPELSGQQPGALQAAEAITDYRVRAKLVTDRDGRLGLFAAGSHRVVDIPGCRILAPPLQAAVSALRERLPLELPLAGADLRLTDAGVLLCLIVQGRAPADALERCASQLWQRIPGLVSLAASERESGAVQLLGGNLRVLRGPAQVRQHAAPGEPWHYAAHGAFTQVHPEQTQRLHERLEQALAGRIGALAGKSVLELYAGSGALALRLAARGAQVTAVESYAPALAQLTDAAAAQGLELATRAQTAEAFLAAARAAPDALIVNPPRRGLSPAVREALARLRPRAIAYISCEPETLARDLQHFRYLGWQLSELTPFDLIPLSEAVECLSLLEPAPLLPPQLLYEDERVLALYQSPFEPAAPQGEAEPSLLERARQALGIPELTPVHGLDRGTSGVCWFARRPELAAALALALEEGEQTYLALARGITRAKGKIARPSSDAGRQLTAITRYRRREVIGGHSLLELRPEHGRKHQLRRQLSSIGHPILGDDRYGQPSANRHFEHRHGLDRMFLHRASVRLELASGVCEVRAELPGDLRAVLESLAAASARSVTDEKARPGD